MKLCQNTIISHFTIAFLIRLTFLVYGIYHDFLCESKENCVKYTDVDYYVFSDAARYVYNDESPYKRETYRYTPLLALILQPNIFLFESFGKILFIIFDLLCGLVILKINSLDRNKTHHYGLYFWFYNPITFAISSRGNAESIMSFLVLIFVYLLLKKKYFLSGCIFSLAIHFKIYPITYSLAILLNLMTSDTKKTNSVKNLIKFSIGFLIIFCTLTWYFYHIYGYEFLHETYLYHLTRKDIRHNFSAYFYLLYANYNSDFVLLKLSTFLPQIFLITIFSFAFYRHLKLCFFLITYSFVTFNKVCTSQYFIWYLSLIPILASKINISFKKSIILFITWLMGQAVWLFYAYKLEFEGENTFVSLWFSSLLFLSINCFIMKSGFIDTYQLDDLKLKKNN